MRCRPRAVSRSWSSLTVRTGARDVTPSPRNAAPHAADSQDTAEPTAVLPDAIAARYGRTSRNRARDRRLIWSAAAAFAVVFVAWVVWAGLDGSRPSIESRNTAHEIVDDTLVSVSFEVTGPQDTPMACSVQALNEQFAVVGWKVVELPPSEQRTRNLTELVRTTELSNTGVVDTCWVVEDGS
nr:DUF4307 domain-containing protein [Plantibacter sp. VKM Ac-2880]